MIYKLATLIAVSGFCAINPLSAQDSEINLDATLQSVLTQLSEENENDGIAETIVLDKESEAEEIEIATQEETSEAQVEETILDEEITTALVEEVFAPEVSDEIDAQEEIAENEELPLSDIDETPIEEIVTALDLNATSEAATELMNDEDLTQGLDDVAIIDIELAAEETEIAIEEETFADDLEIQNNDNAPQEDDVIADEIIEEIFAPEISDEIQIIEAQVDETAIEEIETIQQPKHKRSLAAKIARNALDTTFHKISMFKDSVRDIRVKNRNIVKAGILINKMKKSYKNELSKKISLVRKNWMQVSKNSYRIQSKIVGKILRRAKIQLKNMDESSKKIILANKQIFFAELFLNACEQAQFYINVNAPVETQDETAPAAV